MGAISWLVDHTIGWLFDHTIGLAAERVWRRTRGRDRERDILAALASALGEAVAECDTIAAGNHNASHSTNAQAARHRALALSTSIPDEELGRLTKAATDAIGLFLSHIPAAYAEPYAATMEYIRGLKGKG